LRTTHAGVTGGTASANSQITDSFFDPQVEFQEVGVSLNGARTWKIFGPDLDGTYGSSQGLGGLEATYWQPAQQISGTIQDYFGNIPATLDFEHLDIQYDDWVVHWSPTPVNSYGPVLGYSPRLFSSGVSLADASVWRGKRIEPTGFYWLGARYYDPVAGRFLSPDPLGHSASMDLYSFCDGDPLNRFDPDGRFAKAASLDWYYNGGAAGSLRTLAELFNPVLRTDNTLVSWSCYNSASVLNLLANLSTPASYVDAYHNGVDRSANVMAGERLNGSGWTWTTLQGLSSIVGDQVGYNSAFEAGFGVDRQSMTMLDGVDRTSRGFMALSQMAGTTATLGGMYNPSATFFRPGLRLSGSGSGGGGFAAGSRTAEDLVTWVDEGGNLRKGGNPGMSKNAYDFQSGTPGARSSAVTGRSLAPYLEFTDDAGNVIGAKFDGVQGMQLIDRKTNPFFSAKAVDEATRQVAVAQHYGLQAVWELPNPEAVSAANRFMQFYQITGITVRLAK
jgi:RHS repeat-associated protein